MGGKRQLRGHRKKSRKGTCLKDKEVQFSIQECGYMEWTKK